VKYQILTAPLRLQLIFSPVLAVILLFLSISCSALLFFATLPMAIKIFVFGVLHLSLWQEYRRHLRFYQRKPLQSLVLFNTGIINDADNQSYTIDPSSRIWPWFILLNLRDQYGQIQPMLLFADSLSEPAAYRRLRVRLLHPVSQQAPF
jgi:hypothetical protein